MIIVTGGAGFIGSNLVHALNQRGERDIVVVDRLDGPDQHLNLDGLEFAELLDLDELDALGAIVDGDARAVFHLGACTDTTQHDARFMLERNYSWSKRLLRHALGRRIPFIYASSAAVYGMGSEGFREEPACEHTLNVYATSKLLLDNFVRRLLPSASSPVVGIRYFNVYGGPEHHKQGMASVMLQLYRQLREHGRCRLFEGSEGFRRDFVWVGDAVDVTLGLHDLGVSGIFNCGTGQARSFLDVARSLCHVGGWDAGSIETFPFPEHLQGRYQSFTQADLTRLRQAGYDKVFTSLEDGIAHYFRKLADGGRFFRS